MINLSDDIIKILPNLFVSNYTNINDKEIFIKNNITNIIFINSHIDNYSSDNILDIKIDNNVEYINQNIWSKVNFNKTNEFIYNSYISNKSIIICGDKSLIITFMILVAFVIKYLNIGFSDTISLITTILNLNIKLIPKNIIYELFLFYIK